jgi:uncharacterized membrane protein (UPF0136 family)
MKIAVPIVLIFYGLLLIAGGGLGYAKSQSSVSLMAGGASGILAIAAAVLVMKSGRPGILMGAGVALAVAGMMGKRWLADGAKFMPAGMVTILSLVILAVTVTGFSSLKKK